MKNIKLLLTFFALGFLVFSCREDHTEPVYNGDSYLHFNFGASRAEFVKIGTASKDIQITYGTVKGVSGTHQVKLVVDQTKSTAVAGVDYQILNPTDELTNGETGGTFNVRLMEPSNAQDTKTVVFKLESATIQNAVFDNEYLLTWKLQCLIADFLGTNGAFNNAGWWNGTGQYLIVPHPTTPNVLLVKDFLDLGRDLVLSYNDEGTVTFADQDTGYFHPTYNENIWIRMSVATSAGHGISTIDMCSRKMTLVANYYIPGVGSFGNQQEVFTGF